MKRIILFLCVSLFLVTSCAKFEETPVDTVNERLNAKMQEYQNILEGAEFGWKAYLLTGSNFQKNFTFKFVGNNKVVTVMEDDVDAAEESSYRLKALQRPTLLFDTYSLVHKLVDPDPNIYGGVWAEGYNSDFEFAFLSATENKVVFQGTFNDTQLILVKATSEDDRASTFEDTENLLATVNSLKTYFKRTTYDGKEYEVGLDGIDRVFGLTEYVDGFPVTLSSNFYVIGDEMIFFDPIVLGNDTVRSLNNIEYSGEFISADLGNSKLQIKEAIEPLYYDKGAAARFHSGERQLTFSPWVREGVKDYLNDASIPVVNQRVFWLAFNADYDLLAYAANWSLSFGTAISKTITEDGLLKYTFLGTLGAIPASHRSIILQTAFDFEDPKGLYVIEKGASRYDLVTATDARKWMNITPL